MRLLAEAFKLNHSLRILNLSNTTITAAISLSNLVAVNRASLTLNLWCCKLGVKGIIALSQSLKNNNTITYLNLYGNNMGSKGALALCEALKRNIVIKNLNLGYKDIDYIVLSSCERLFVW